MPRCKWCGTEIRNKRKLINQHEPHCEWKDKIESWQKRVAENQCNIFWYADPKTFVLKPCVLSTNYQMIRFFKDDGGLGDWSQGFKDTDLFSNEADTRARVDYLKGLYLETFKHRPFMNEEMLVNNLSEFIYIEKTIAEKLEDHPNFMGIDFCNVGAHGIQIRGHHKQVKGYTYGTQPTINYDFSNYLNCIEEFVEMWKIKDVPDKVRGELSMIADGEKYGWD